MAFKDGFTEFPELHSERLVLRELKECDAPAYHKHVSALPENRWSSMDRQSVDFARRRIQQFHNHFAGKRGVRWGLFDAVTDGLLGMVELFDFEHRSKAEIGYWLAREHWNHGFMAEAVSVVVKFAFDTMELHRVYARTGATNAASQKMLTKVGFRKEGLLRKDQRCAGVWTDSVVMGILRDDR